MASEHSFTSYQPHSGAPSLLWETFKCPRLRRFPESVDSLKLGSYLGGGIDGLVFKARERGRTGPLAVKIVNSHLGSLPCLAGYVLF
jgi:hypothetical protein